MSRKNRVNNAAVQQRANKEFFALASTLMERMGSMAGAGTSHSGARDLDTVFGYAKTLKPADYLKRYRRQDIFARIIDAFPDATWREDPTVSEVLPDEDPEREPTQFELDWKALQKRVNVYEYMQRADRLAGLGRFSVLLIGHLDGGADLKAELKIGDGMGGAGDPTKLLYLRPYSEASVTKIELEEKDATSERFGLPMFYTIKVGDKDQIVHWTRIIHIAEGLLEDDVYGTPRGERIMDRLYDLAKVVGGASESFWLNARGMVNAKLAADATMSAADLSAVGETVDEMIHQLRRFVKTQGVDLNPLQFNIADPSPVVAVLIDLIAGAEGIPKRILTGSEAGELASSQDEENWKSRISERRRKFAVPRVLYAMIDRFVALGILTKPNDYKAEWQERANLSPVQLADVRLKGAQALQAAFGFNVGDLPAEFVLRAMHYTDEEVKQWAPLIDGGSDPLDDDAGDDEPLEEVA